MKIAIDAREFKRGANTGLRTILYNFLAHAGEGKHEFVFFCNQHTEPEGIPAKGKRVVLNERLTFFWDQVILPRAIKEQGADVFFSPYVKTPFWRVCPYVNAISDIIPLVAPKRGGIFALLEKAHFYAYSFICGRRAVKIVTLSANAGAKVSKVFRIRPEKIKVVYPSVDLGAFASSDVSREDELVKKYGLDKPYILYTGNFKPHKNLGRLITAFALLPREIRDKYRLLLVGGSAKEMPAMERTIRLTNLPGRIMAVGSLPHEDISVFMKKAAVFVFPSLAEGFGIPPLEALALGTPVASSNIAPMTEVLGDAAVFFDPYDPSEISKAIKRLLSGGERREGFTGKGQSRASFFSPEGMSRKLMKVIEDAGAEKVLFTTSEYPPVKGGISTTVFNLFKRLPREKAVLLTALAGLRGEYAPDGGLDVVREAYPLGKSFLARVARTVFVIWNMWRMNSLRRIRHNHCAQIMSAGLGGFILKKLKGVKYTVYVYSADILEFSRSFPTRWLMGKVLRDCEKVITCSRFTGEVAVKSGGVPRGKIVVITPGVDADFFAPTAVDKKIGEKLRIPENLKVLLTVARLDERKGHDTVIKVLPGILRKHPGLIYLVVGGGENMEKLKELARSKGVISNIIFAGEQPQERLVSFYNACDIFIMVPRYLEKTGSTEGFGTVFLEANACGKPVIAGRSGGVAEAVIDGGTGLLVDPEDKEDVKNAILRLLEDGEYARKLGDNGLKRARKDFSWDARARELEKYL